jgi:hypothetical protein
VLGKGGQFRDLPYLQGLILPAAQRFRKLLKQYFSEVSTSRTVWLNVLPPSSIVVEASDGAAAWLSGCWRSGAEAR